MQDSITYYKAQLVKYKAEVSKIYKQLTALSTARIVVFLATALLVYFTFNNWQIAVICGLFGVILFVYLLSKHTSLKAAYSLKKAIVDINEEELKIASGEFYHRNDGLEFQDPNHNYALDIDLFGRGSFFQFINRTATKVGALRLSNSLKANDINNIEDRQYAIKELSSKPEWRQNFEATAGLIEVETKPEQIINWLQNHKSFLPKKIKQLPLLFSILTIIIVGLSIAKIIPVAFVGYWLLLGLAITGKYLKSINNLAAQTSKIRDTFRQYSQLLNAIETETFNASLLKNKQHAIQLEGKKASVILIEFSKAMDSLDNRNNLISAIFGNGFFLTDIKNSYTIEQWIETYKAKVGQWFDVVTFFDAYNSLGNYAFNHQGYVFPKILESKNTTTVIDLGHPLLKTEKRVDNNFNIETEQFFIITGANMAGKSTFLRTVSLHIVMANCGLPVCAKSSDYVPVKLITSMRTSDSLADDSSYFFSELTRLKYIVDAIKTDRYFIILDEILKGTNSTDKAIGSRKFVEKLVASNATGIIATHDLSLCEIEKELEEVKNYYFDAQIIDDELYFDYTFKKGVCQNMNASFLLKKMEIV
ncbi:DNA mismatch repair protein MutS [Lacinutrix sp. 5H-3-7-4]|uniref:MutS-related protein n=1 Tax=Lacinutrix sp. (strain 5H-3-7-4) TaxID=983544 RepID=UPI00020A3B49|nr:DNA mismatch repair protein MutS [Lacinutrix sp. 5H-3-7-4]AEH01050.1 DNA mismatch repair protein MutS domain protein [Lacinutrix sp. 5H-3-7-4]